MRVLHFSVTPLAGAPIRLVRALQKHSQVEARHVVLHPDAYGTRTFDTDLVWPRDREVVLELLGEADVVHLHHYFDLSSNPFEIDFRRWMSGKRRIIRQIHSHPMHISRATGLPVEQIVFPDVPQLVIAQFHERYYPYAHIVPNIVPIDAPDYLPLAGADASEDVTLFFAPSVDASAWAQSDPPLRWDTKGFPETAAMLTDLARRIPHVFARIVRNVPHDRCMVLRRTCQLAIDEMVTGSYHLCSLESMAQGLPTFAFLDRRMVSILAELTGCSELPWLNYRLEDALPALERLVNEPELRRALGANSRRWMETYWREEDMVRHYLNAYRLLVSDSDEFRKPRFDPTDRCATWNARGQDDADWISRVARHRI